MKRTGTIIILLVIVVAFIFGIRYLWVKDQVDPVVYETETPSTQTIVKETVATGSIVPLEEVLIKPNISGIIDKIFIEAGDQVKAGDLIATIKVVPNVSNLNNAKNQIRSAQIALDNQEKIYNRQKALFDKGVISANDFDQINVAYEQAKQDLISTRQNYEIIKTGTTSGMSTAAQTSIRSTVSGMVLEVPVKEGNQVIEANNFNDGTTIATLADVEKMIFEGKVDESEVGKINEGLPLEITVGAIENAKFDAVLDYIAPKGLEENGAIQFEIKGTLKKVDSIFIRAGLSANAAIILAKADSVLAISEALVQYDPETKEPFVEIATGDQQFERKAVELGVSNGILVEIKSGLNQDDKIKVWNALKPEENFQGRG
ncbi:efflux RND transporter periplasmic adaptor subunit [Gangjinia marincola]|uniref:Efflux RND transporter periplasmic adaptor subunit n=1 Tax=Gangjinia marincola TaxID=578463 RepID=A0ABN1MED2_9FLAO